MNFFKIISSFVFLSTIVMIFSMTIFLQSEKDFNQQTKEITVSIVKKVRDFVYYEATIHNPKGDVLPDNLDNSIISKINSVFN